MAKAVEHVDMFSAAASEKEAKRKEEQAKTETDTIKSMNLFEKMSNITAEVGWVSKNLDVNIGKGSYKAVSETDVLKAVIPAEKKYRVYSFPFSREIVAQKELVKKSGQFESIQNYFMVHTVYRFLNIDKPDEHVDIDTYGEGIDSGDKGAGKAMTYSDKYGLMKAYKIKTGDDPDAVASDEYQVSTPDMITDEQIKTIKELYGENSAELTGSLTRYGLSSIEQMTVQQASRAIAWKRKQNAGNH